LEEIQSLIEKVRSDIQEGRPETEILQTLAPVLEKESESAGRLIEELLNIPSLQVARLLQALLEIPCDKKIRKVVKRSLYRLKSKGIAVEEGLRKREHPVFRPLQADPPQGFGGPVDFIGQRFMVLIIPRIGGGLTVMQGIISDTEGLIDFTGGEMPRKRFKEIFNEIQQKNPFPFIEMEPSYVGFLLFQAYQLTLRKGNTPSQEYLHLKKQIESVKKEYEKSLVYSFIQEDEIERNDSILGRGGDLLKTDLFDAWEIGEKEIRPYADAVWEAEESKLILSQAQKEGRFQEIYQGAISDLFPEEKRALYRRRMEEMAYFLFKLGREEEAKISLAVALDLQKAPNQIQPNPFLFQLVVKSIFSLLSEAYEKKKEEFSLIKRP
jgi:hypothetical protein